MDECAIIGIIGTKNTLVKNPPVNHPPLPCLSMPAVSPKAVADWQSVGWRSRVQLRAMRMADSRSGPASTGAVKEVSNAVVTTTDLTFLITVPLPNKHHMCSGDPAKSRTTCNSRIAPRNARSRPRSAVASWPARCVAPRALQAAPHWQRQPEQRHAPRPDRQETASHDFLSGLPNGVRRAPVMGVGLFGRELGGRQCARDGMGVEHRPMVQRVVPIPMRRNGCLARFVNCTRSQAEPRGPIRPQVRSR